MYTLHKDDSVCVERTEGVMKRLPAHRIRMHISNRKKYGHIRFNTKWEREIETKMSTCETDCSDARVRRLLAINATNTHGMAWHVHISLNFRFEAMNDCRLHIRADTRDRIAHTNPCHRGGGGELCAECADNQCEELFN